MNVTIFIPNNKATIQKNLLAISKPIIAAYISLREGTAAFKLTNLTGGRLMVTYYADINNGYVRLLSFFVSYRIDKLRFIFFYSGL
jgi:hypothetical protein